MRKICLVVLIFISFVSIGVSTFEVDASTLDGNVYVELDQSSVITLDQFISKGNSFDNLNDLYLVIEIDYDFDDQKFFKNLKDKKLDKEVFNNKVSDFFYTNNIC